MVVIIVSLFFQLAAVIVAIYLIIVTERYFAWIMVATAISLMAVRRIITLTTIINNIVHPTDVSLAEYTALAISVLLSLGLYFLIPLFKSLRKTQDELELSNQQLIVAKEKALENEAFIENVFENIPSMIFIKNADDLRFVRVNKAAEELLGYTKNELNGRMDYDFFPKDQADFFTSKDRAVLENNTLIIVEEESIDTKFGKRILSTKKIAIRDAKGRNRYLLGISEDITSRKAIENALIVAKEKAEESDRLKSAFLQNISHEIRTPLNAICGFSEKINSPRIDDERRKLYSKIIVDNGLQLLNIVTDLLTISALETGQARVNNTTVCINQLLREQYATLTKQIGTKKIILSIGKSLDEETSTIITDKDKLTRILTNLISNAIKFTQAGSVDFGCQIKGCDLEFYVKDTGIGVDQSKYEWIFKRFVQADSEIQHTFGGTGLGLSICKGLVELIGGKIWLESEPNQGSTFYFTIPYVPAQKEKIDNGQNTSNVFSVKGQMILLVENVSKSTKSLTDTFDEVGCSLIIANNGLDALNICIDKPEIDIAIIDLELQGIDAQTTVTLIKEVRPEIEFFALSDKKIEHNGSGDSDIYVNYLVKPITAPAIIDLVTYYGKSNQQ